MYRLIKKVSIVLPLLTLLFVGVSVISPTIAHAVTGADWKAGNIIDDGVFYNNNDMSVADIQNFLNSKVTCDTWGTKPSEWGGGTRAQYGASKGYPAPYICLKNYTQDGKTAAQIIKEAADLYRISSKSLIVLLQKEQALVTDEWPWPNQYRSATGYGCPDTAPCDAEYYGFHNQVLKAAYQFRRYATYPSEYLHKPYQNNSVRFNPNAGCGSTNVYIENLATAGLYNYTPYQPNASALGNLYGAGDNCGAYGNRNFWRLFNDWFGSVRTATFSWQTMGQAAFTDATKSSRRGLQNVLPGERIYLEMKVKNTGNFTWSNGGANPVRVGTLRATDRRSIFADSTWPGFSRPAEMKEALTAPGEIATFEFWIKVPATATGSYSEYFGLVSEGNSWFPDQGLFFGINVTKPTYTWDLISQYAATDETNTVGRSLIGLEPGERVYVSMRIKNTGNMTWSNSGNNPLDLGISRPTDRLSYFFDDRWLGQNRPARMKESSVPPGQVATFEFYMKAPYGQPGPFYEYFTPVIEGVTWMEDIGLNYYGTIKKPSYTYDVTSQYAYTNSSKITPTGLTNLTPGTTSFVGFTVRNTGNVTWFNSGPYAVKVGTSRPYNRISPYYDPSTWIGPSRPVVMKESAVGPGQNATFEFNYKAPLESGSYKEYYNLLIERVDWMSDIGLYYSSSVQ